MCSFILASISRDFALGQEACWKEHVFDNCLARLDEPDFLLRQWAALCLGVMWAGYGSTSNTNGVNANGEYNAGQGQGSQPGGGGPGGGIGTIGDKAKVWGLRCGAPDRLNELLSDESVEVRCAALYALGTFMGASGSRDKTRVGGGGTGSMSLANPSSASSSERSSSHYHRSGRRGGGHREEEYLDEYEDAYDERWHFRMEVAVVTGAVLAVRDDASPMCRKELLVMVSCLVKEWRGHFVVCAWVYWEEERRWREKGLKGKKKATAGSASGTYHEHVKRYNPFEAAAAQAQAGSSGRSTYSRAASDDGHGDDGVEEDEEWSDSDPDITGTAISEYLDTFSDPHSAYHSHHPQHARTNPQLLREESRVLLSSLFTIFVILLDLSVDPYPEVATNAQTIVDYVMALLLASPFRRLGEASVGRRPGEEVLTEGAGGAGALGMGPGGKPGHRRVDSTGSFRSVRYVPSDGAPPSPGPGYAQQEFFGRGNRPAISRSDTMTSATFRSSSANNASTNAQGGSASVYATPNPNMNLNVVGNAGRGGQDTIRRSTSFMNAVKNFVAFPSSEVNPNGDGRASPSILGTFNFPSIGRGGDRDRERDHQQHGAIQSHHGRDTTTGVSRPPSPNLNFATYESPYAPPPGIAYRPSSSSGQAHGQTQGTYTQGYTYGQGQGQSGGYGQAGPPSPPSSGSGAYDFSALDAMEALMEEDMERLRARRRPPRRGGGGGASAPNTTPPNGTVNGHSYRNHQSQFSYAQSMAAGGVPPSPSSSSFSGDTESVASSVILGIGTGLGIRDVLPLRSTFFDWCCEYFTEPQMRVGISELPLSFFSFIRFYSKRRETSLVVCSIIIRFGDSRGMRKLIGLLVHRSIQLVCFHTLILYLLTLIYLSLPTSLQ
jgi:regulatory associated protein of mTOR